MLGNDKEDIDLLQNLFRESDEKFKLLYESEPFVYDSVDENGNIVEISAGWLRLLGYTREEVVGHWLGEFLTPEFQEKFKANWHEVKNIGVVDNVYQKLVRKDGTVIDTVIYARIRYDDNGNYLYSHCITHDISEQKKANEALIKSEYEKALILDVMSDAIIFLDTNMKVLWANRNAAAPFNISMEQMVGMDCFNETDTKVTACGGSIMRKALQSGLPETGECSHGANTYIISVYPAKNAEGDLIGAVHVAHDITERKRLERDLMERSTIERQKFGRDLHDGLGQLLTGISFIARALQAKLEEQSLPEASDAGKLEEIAEKALMLTHVLAKGLCPVGLDAGGFLTAISDLTMSTETMFGVTCTFKYDKILCNVDRDVPEHVYYIVQEAITNAIKHGKAKNISITVCCADNRLLLTVTDDGVGMPDLLDGSQGMGLLTMKYRASVLGGNLVLQNNEGSGVTLICSLPHRRSANNG